MINHFLDWAQEQADVWIVSNEQLLDWVRHPVPASQLNQVSSFQCSTPQVSSTEKICNGIPQNENGLLDACDFPDFPFFTCYGCPTETPTPDQPNPQQSVAPGAQARFRLPSNCSTPFWDPVAGKCICTSSTCQFTDNSRPIGPNGANLTGGGTGGSASGAASSSFVPFNGAPVSLMPAGVLPAIILGCVGALLGAFGVVTRI
jgi:hypothetical protein